jgi:Tfp pilus assembly protein PilF
MAAHVSANDQLLADEVLRDFLASGARSAQAANLYARVLAQRGDWAKAAQMLDAAMAQGGVRAPDLLALRSVAAARLDKKDEAREFAWAAYRLNPFYPPAILALKQVSNDEAVVARMDEKLNALQRSAR